MNARKNLSRFAGYPAACSGEGFINLAQPKEPISYQNLGTEISIARQIDSEGNPNLILMTFRDYFESSSKYSEMLDKALISHEVTEGTTTSFVGLERVSKSSNPKVIYLRLRSTDLTRSDSNETDS